MKPTRRDRCFLTGKRASLLRPAQASLAWQALAASMIGMGDMDIPKFESLLGAVRAATIDGRRGV